MVLDQKISRENLAGAEFMIAHIDGEAVKILGANNDKTEFAVKFDDGTLMIIRASELDEYDDEES